MLLVLLCTLIAGLLMLGLWVPIIGFEQTIHTMMGLEAESHLLLALPVSFMLAALYKIASNWIVRNKDYPGLALSKLWQSLPQTAGQISLGLLHFGAWGLVIGEIVGRLLGFLALTVRGREMCVAPRLTHLRRRVGTLLSYYRHYPLYSTWSALINQAGSVAPVFFLAALYEPGTAGLFALVQRVFALPMDLVGQTALTMYMAEASHAIRTDIGKLYRIFLRTFLSLLVLAVIPASLLIWSGPRLFDVVFGHEWYVAGIYAQIVALAYGVRLAVSPISQTMQMLGRQKLVLLIEVTRLVSIVGVFACGYLLRSEVEAVLSWYSAILIGFQMWMLFATWQLVKRVKA